VKRLFGLCASLLLFAGIAVPAIAPAVAAYAATPTNLIANPLLATPSSTSSSLPQGWLEGNWGTNTTAFSYPTTGYNGGRSVEVNTTKYTSGDAKWYFTPVTVSAATAYTFSDYYEANVSTEVVVQLSDSAGDLTYQDLGSVPTSSTWAPYSASFTTAANTTQATVFHLIQSVGSLQTDDFSLTQGTTTTTPTPTPTPPSTNGNLVPNATLVGTSGTLAQPTSWLKGGWGTNTPVYSYLTSGYGSNDSVKVQLTSYTSGDAKWYFNPVAVSAGSQYTFSDYYESTVASDVVVQFDNGSGTYQYLDLGTVGAAATWTNYQKTFTVPTGMKNMTVFHLISSVGTLTTSDFSVLPYTAPVVTTPTVTVTAPAANATISGNVTLSATTTGSGITSFHYNVDNVAISNPATTAAAPVTWNSKAVLDGTHTITAVATTVTSTYTSAPVTVTVSNNGNNMVPNPLVSIVNPSNTNTPEDWTTDNWGTNTTTFSYLTTGYNGGRSVKVQMTSYTNGDGKWSFPAQTVTTDTQYTFSDYYESTVNTEVDAVFNMSDGTTEYQIIGLPSAASSWAHFSSSFVVPLGTQTVTVYHLIQSVGSLTTSDFSMTPYQPVGFKRALVTLTFDDGYISTYTYAQPLLDQYGYKATQFIITDLLGTTGYMTDQNVQALNTDGQEIASHTVTHDDMTQEAASQITTELSQSQTILKQLTGKAVTDIAYPYGEYDTTVQSATAKYYTAARGVEDGLNSKDNFNAYDLKVQNIYDTTTTAQVADWVKQAQTTDTWLILVYHAVDPDTTSTIDGGLYNATPTQLSEQLSAVKSSGITVETMQQALAEVKPQL
jgi:peptidoglycan/xylan/chitin deacetylase (PgdA/CDA1 family)